MAASVSYAQARRRLDRAGEPGEDDRALRLRLLEALRAAVPFDAYAWLLTDPLTAVGTAPVADVPCLARLPELIRLRYLTPLHRWTAMDRVAATHLPAEVGDGDRPDDRTGDRADDWAGLLAEYGITDVASVVFRDRYGCWGWLDLWRTPVLGGFRAEELAFLTELAGPVARALRGSTAATFAARPAPAGPGGPAVLLLSPDLRVVRQTPQSEEYLRRLVPPGDGQPPVPANAYNVAARLLAGEAAVDDGPALSRAHLGGGRWVTLRAARLDGREPPARRDVAVTIEQASAEDRLAVFERCHGLSAREAELLRHLVAGGDTRALAGRMFLSEHTVQDYLKSLFAKTATRSRGALVSRVLGT